MDFLNWIANLAPKGDVNKLSPNLVNSLYPSPGANSARRDEGMAPPGILAQTPSVVPQAPLRSVEQPLMPAMMTNPQGMSMLPPETAPQGALAGISPEPGPLPPQPEMAPPRASQSLPQMLPQAGPMSNPVPSRIPQQGGGKEALITSESGGNWAAENNAVGSSGRAGHYGRLQFGHDRLDEARAALGVQFSPEDFKASPDLQQRVEDWHFNDIDSFVGNNGLEAYLNTEVLGVPMTRQGMRNVAHLGGKDGLKHFLESGGQYNPADSNGTRLSDYARKGAAGGGNTPYTEGPSENGGVLSASGREAPLDQTNAEPQGFWGKADAFLQKGNNSDMLLAIGGGLLSGGNWAEGMSAASTNLLGVNQNYREEQFRNEQAQLGQDQQGIDNEYRNRTEDRANRALDISEKNSEKATQQKLVPLNITGRNKETGELVTKAGTAIDGIPHVYEGGKMVPADQVMNDPSIGSRGDRGASEAGAGGIPNAASVSESGIPTFQFKRESEAQAYGWGLRMVSAAKDIEKVTEMAGPEGITNLTDGLQRWAANNAGKTITGAVINDIVAGSGLNNIAASAMTQYLQGVLRADTGAAYTATEIADYGAAFLPNIGDPPETQEYKRRVRDTQIMGVIGRTGAASSYLGGLHDGTYTLPGGDQFQPEVLYPNSAPASSGDTESILKGYGL